MIGMARLYTSDQALIEDAVQDTWIAVLRGLPRFEQRSSITTWVLRILLYRLKTRLPQDNRLIPCSHLFDAATARAEPAVAAGELYLGQMRLTIRALRALKAHGLSHHTRAALRDAFRAARSADR